VNKQQLGIAIAATVTAMNNGYTLYYAATSLSLQRLYYPVVFCTEFPAIFGPSNN